VRQGRAVGRRIAPVHAGPAVEDHAVVCLQRLLDPPSVNIGAERAVIEDDPWRVFRPFDQNMEAAAGFNFDHVKWGVHREKSPQASSGMGEGNGLVESWDL